MRTVIALSRGREWVSLDELSGASYSMVAMTLAESEAYDEAGNFGCPTWTLKALACPSPLTPRAS